MQPALGLEAALSVLPGTWLVSWGSCRQKVGTGQLLWAHPGPLPVAGSATCSWLHLTVNTCFLILAFKIYYHKHSSVI